MLFVKFTIILSSCYDFLEIEVGPLEVPLMFSMPCRKFNLVAELLEGNFDNGSSYVELL